MPGTPLATAPFAPPTATTICANRYRVDIVATTPMTPHLNGQLKTYLAETMTRLQKGRRATAVPSHIPATATLEAIDEMAGFYAGIKAQRPKQ